jgi:hypothetical protein
MRSGTIQSPSLQSLIGERGFHYLRPIRVHPRDPRLPFSRALGQRRICSPANTTGLSFPSRPTDATPNR